MSGLERFAEGVWTLARSQRFYGVETGTRTTVVRLEGGGLFVHCPVALDDATRAEVDGLGEVRAVVAPSLFHHLYVGEWMRAYPRATFWACPGLEQKRADLAWTGTVDGDVARAEWADALEQAPLTARFEREVVFFHRATRTLICADALLNLRRHPSPLTRAVAVLMRNTGPGLGWMERFTIRDRALGRRQADRVLDWDIDGVVLAHGDLVTAGGREAFRRAYAWV